ncbi:GHKL domain-containing protein [Anaerobacillus sp. CMMVII]|uniref:sensor histidine kinase n=1 Tax=Anaerobacillus sp. CMMVII TaxID=2755588 RepID=UPI0021B808E2|nr:ATP-binding protein [Anaerobacillus sp. CMMVII]MCT8137736.1 GHKL domain-containing protein [Anaerobacillus sp. CMMVII]
MFRTLQSRLMFFFLLVSLGGIIFVSGVIQYSFTGSFNEYLETKRTEQVAAVVERLEEEYHNLGQITGETMMPIFHQHAMVDQLFFQYYDENDTLIIDSARHLHMMQMPRIENLDRDLYSITVDDQQIGTLLVFFPREYVNIDSQFLQQFNKYIVVAALTMILISILISYLLSKKLSQGLRRVSMATGELRKNNLEIRIPEDNQVEEINQLAKSFNDLALSLSNQEKLRKQFTNDLAHELRTPLATLRSQIEAFLDGVWEPTPERLQQGHQELMRLVRLVDDLEKLLAAENPQIQLRLTNINLRDALQSLNVSFHSLFKEKGIRLHIEEAKPELFIHADQDRFYQILINLLNNALKYTNEGGTVTLTTKQKDDEVHFIIEDNGQGISEADLPHIYERFYRGEKSRNRKTGGVGIGLSIVKALVDAHKGKIMIESEQTKGTKVVVSLPKSE